MDWNGKIADLALCYLFISRVTHLILLISLYVVSTISNPILDFGVMVGNNLETSIRMDRLSYRSDVSS